MEEFGDKYFKRVQKVCLIQVIFNYILTAIKFIGGFLGSSHSLINDGINSLGDVVTSSVSLFASKASSKKADEEHQFGHEKIESLVCLIFAIILGVVSVLLIYSSITTLIDKSYLESNSDNLYIALIFALIAIFTKISLFFITYINYKKTKSNLLKTQSLDHLSDSISTIISIISICVILFSTNSNYKIFDSIASLIIGILIVIGAIKIAFENCSLLLDKAANKDLSEKIKNLILSSEGVLHIDAFRSRMVGNRVFLEIEISCFGSLSLIEAHNIAENLREKILSSYQEVKHVLIHVNPDEHKEESNL